MAVEYREGELAAGGPGGEGAEEEEGVEEEEEEEGGEGEGVEEGAQEEIRRLGQGLLQPNAEHVRRRSARRRP